MGFMVLYYLWVMQNVVHQPYDRDSRHHALFERRIEARFPINKVFVVRRREAE